MIDFRTTQKQFSSVSYVYDERDEIMLDPPYQRLGDIWPEDKRQLLIDSILNGFDIPKIYFHEFIPPKRRKGAIFNYAIVDGKQRLESIWGFMDGKFALADDFKYFHDRKVAAGGMTYRDLALQYPKLKSRFDATSLPIILIQTRDVELIEEMFSRLNEAVPLNAAEKRNAFGGPLPPIIRELSKHKFFDDKLPYGNRRYRHLDLATKFLYIEHNRKFTDTKKTYLDQFVRSYKSRSEPDARKLMRAATGVLDRMASLFRDNDSLLASVGMSVLYYLLVREAQKQTWADSLSRDQLTKFEDRRAKNRKLAEKDLSKADYDLIEFDRFSQWLNDEVAVLFRYKVLRTFVTKPQTND